MTPLLYRNLTLALLVMMVIANYIMHTAGLLFDLASAISCVCAATMGASISFSSREFKGAPPWFIPMQSLLFISYLIVLALCLANNATILPPLPFMFSAMMVAAFFIPMLALVRHGAALTSLLR